MTTFIERHGYIRYPLPGYQRSGPCEIPKCEEYRSRLNDYTDQIVRNLNERYGSNYPLSNDRPPSYVVDHCHVHGWIRGIICNACNTILGLYEKYGEATTEYSPAANTFLVDPTIKNYSALKAEISKYRETAFKEYLNNCPECAGMPAPKSAKKAHLMYQTPRECPRCHGDKIEPRPICLYFNVESRPCEKTGEQPPCSQCGDDMDEVCTRCNGAGIAVLVKSNCEECEQYRFIVDETAWYCKECYDNMESSETIAEFEAIMSELRWTSEYLD